MTPEKMIEGLLAAAYDFERSRNWHDLKRDLSDLDAAAYQQTVDRSEVEHCEEVKLGEDPSARVGGPEDTKAWLLAMTGWHWSEGGAGCWYCANGGLVYTIRREHKRQIIEGSIGSQSFGKHFIDDVANLVPAIENIQRRAAKHDEEMARRVAVAKQELDCASDQLERLFRAFRNRSSARLRELDKGEECVDYGKNYRGPPAEHYPHGTQFE